MVSRIKVERVEPNALALSATEKRVEVNALHPAIADLYEGSAVKR
jgi:hypothetical protein